MNNGDKIRVVKGEHEGKTGYIVDEYVSAGLGRVAREVFKGWWLVELDEGPPQRMIHEPFMKVIDPTKD